MDTYKIWPQLPPPLANQILIEIQKNNKKLYKTALDVMAPRMGIRVPILIEMPKVERHATFVQILSRPETEILSFNLLSGWLISTQTPMLKRWLTLLNIPHGENGCADEFPPSPSKETLSSAVNQLLLEFPHLHVAIYLRCFNQIDEVKWEPLAKIIDDEPQLQFSAPETAGQTQVA